MGRRKLEMKRIEDKSSRQVTFSKRRNGLMKKARELAILCDVDVTVIVFSNRGRLYDFCSGESLPKSLQRYQNHFEAEGSIIANDDSVKEGCVSLYSTIRSCSELLDAVAMHINEPDVDKLNLTDLVQLEKQLDAALIQTRFQKNKLMAESMNTLHQRERSLREENRLLMQQIAELENSGNAGGIAENGNLDNSHTTIPQWETLRFL